MNIALLWRRWVALWVGAGCCLLAALAGGQQPGGAATFAAVTPDYGLQFPQDYGSHPAFRTEWWYLTGWLTTAQRQPLGFQITFFRSATGLTAANPSAFAARQLLIAHVALSDPDRGRLWTDQRVRREGLGLAQAQTDTTRVWLDDWRLERSGERYTAQINADGFALQLQFLVTQPPMLNGRDGYSQKGPLPTSASDYYSEPHLQVSGRIARGSRSQPVQGEAWLDHEWSSQYLAPQAAGWDWVGINLNEGAALMAFRIRARDGQVFWAGASLRDASGQHSFSADQIQFVPLRRWRSGRSGVTYPVSWRLIVGAHQWTLRPLLDDQENDARLSSGTLYWEGAVQAFEREHRVGQGYLELTGYDRPLSWP